MPLMVQLSKIRKSDIRTFFRSDRAILLACMAISLLIWFLIKLSQEYRSEFSFDMEYQISDQHTFLRPPPTEIRASATGTGWALMGNQFGRTKKLILNSTDPGEVFRSSTWIKSRIMEKSSSNLQWVEVTPEFIKLDLVKKKVKKVPVKLAAKISFSPGFHFAYPPSIRPDSVLLSGPAPLLDTISFWETDSLVRVQVKNSLDLKLPLQKKPEALIALSPKEIRVQAEVEQLTEKVLFLPLTVRNAPENVRIFPNKIKISVAMGLKDYNIISSSDFIAEVDLTDARVTSLNNTVPITITKKPYGVLSVHLYTKSVEFYFVKNENQNSPAASTLTPAE